MKIKYFSEYIGELVKYRFRKLCTYFYRKDRRKLLLSRIRNQKAEYMITRHARHLSCNVGMFTYCDPSIYVGNKNTIIGKFCSIGRDVAIGPGIHPVEYLSTSPYFYFDGLGWVEQTEFIISEPCRIGHDVWIGQGAFIKDGITIGDGAIIAANAAVVKDVPPYAIVGGVPAKIIKYRFSEEVINELLEIEWWNMDISILKKCPYNDIEESIKYLKNNKENKNE